MIDIIRVTKAVKKLAEIDDEAVFDIVPTVKTACAEISGRLKKEEYASDERVLNAAVCLSYYRVVLSKVLSGDIQTQFKAGDITVSQSPEIIVEKAAALRDEAMCAASPLIDDVDFIFRQV